MLTIFAVALSLAAPPMLRVSVEGEGFLRFAQDGHALYTTSAPLTIVNGWLSNANGAPLVPTLRVPEGTRRVDVNADGEVFAATPYYRARVGRISLAVFRDGSGLVPYGSFLVSSETPELVPAGREGAGSINTLLPGEPLPANKPESFAVRVSATVPASDPFVQQWIKNPAPRVLHSEIGQESPRSGVAEITIADVSQTPNDTYTLGDIAVVDAEPELRAALMQVVLGDTPGYRRSAPIREEDVLAQIVRAGFDPSQFTFKSPRRPTIGRTFQKVGKDSIEGAAMEAAAKVYGEGVPMKASFRKDDAIAPIGELSFEAESCIPTRSGASVIVVTKVNGERFSSRVVRVSVMDASALLRTRQDLH